MVDELVRLRHSAYITASGPPPARRPPAALSSVSSRLVVTPLGVNLDGPALTVGDDAWLLSPSSVLARYINLSLVLYPETDSGRVDMLRAGFFFHDDSFSYPVENGSYALIAYAWSADGAETGTLSVQDEERDTFHATSFAGGGPWVPLGPYRLQVTDGKLKLAANGDLRIGGIELRLLDE